MNKIIKYPISLIISGGQTGADRGGLDFAIKNKIPHNGWCPQNRKAEDYSIPQKYSLIETKTTLYPARTRMNIRDSDATLIFTSNQSSKGTLLTIKFCIELKKPYLTIQISNNINKIELQIISDWLNQNKPSILNIAGSRESHSPGIQQKVADILEQLLMPSNKKIKWPPKRRPFTPSLFV